MKKVDFIIVGQGIAGTVLGYELLKRKKNILIVDEFHKNTSSRIALGIYNPLVLKWFTKSWLASVQIKKLFSFCENFQKDFGVNINHKKNIYKFLDSNYAINNWNEKQSSPKRKHFMSEELKYLDGVKAPFGIVLNSGWVDIKLMLNSFRKFLQKNNFLSEERFLYDKLKINKEFIEYKSYRSKYIVFCEGASVLQNPYFNNLEFKMTKGEIIHFKSEDLKLNKITHSGIITIPISNDTYFSGATFNWDIKDLICTENAKNHILEKIKKMRNFTYKLIEQKVAIRPSVKDRRPIIGNHNKYKNLYLMNGLGSRGMLLAPYLTNQLCSNILEKKEINSEINVTRFQ